MALQYCRNCVMPETKPDLSFDEAGVCDACRSAEWKDKVDWIARRRELEGLCDEFRSRDGSSYDCIVPSSGGKDSHYQTHVMKVELGMNPLCVTWTPCSVTPLGWQNVWNLQELGVDYLQFTGNRKVYRAIVKEAFRRIGDCCWPEHVGIFTVPVRVAIQYGIKLIVWGENSQLEYGGPAQTRFARTLDRRWMEEYGGLGGLRVTDLVGFQGLGRRDLLPYFYPEEAELSRASITGIFLGSYIKWDARRQVETVKRLGFTVNEEGPQEGTYTNYENLDCKWVGLHDYLKFLKYGFGRATDHACIDIRNKRLNRGEALDLVKKYDGKVPRKYLADFLREMEITEAEFFKVLDSFTNRPLFALNPDGSLHRDRDGELVKRNYDNVGEAPPARAVASAR